MLRRPDFIGLGGGRSGTNWVMACLFDHPEVFVPGRELNFFSRERNWPKGYEWYESILGSASQNAKKAGELSASYLADPHTPERIHRRYPDVKLIVAFRNPIERAFSSYINDIKAGAIPKTMSFAEALQARPFYVDYSRHATNISRFLQFFSRDQIKMMIYEDSLKDPESYIGSIYEFIGVDSSHVSSFFRRRVNTGRVPKSVGLDGFFNSCAGFLKKRGFYGIWWFLKKSGISSFLLKMNTSDGSKPELNTEDRIVLRKIFEPEVRELEKILGRKIDQWQDFATS